MTSLHLREVSASYDGRRVVGPLSLQTRAGECVILVGQSGAGKSTLLDIIFQELKPQAAFIPQELGLVQSLSVFHNVFMGRLSEHSAIYNLVNLVRPMRRETEAILPILRGIDLDDKIWSATGELSGGQKQRTAVARAIYQQANMLIADEPISALDGPLAEKVIKTLVTAYPTAIIALHDIELALRYGQRIVGIKEGLIALDETSNQLTLQDLKQFY
jgi:phosphonate transport system ATP-binding protein